MNSTFGVIEFLFFLYFLILTAGYLFLNISSYFIIRTHLSKRLNDYWPKGKLKNLPGISIVAPAYNEELTIVESVNSMLNLDYPNYEIIVVCDGSKDKTFDRLTEAFQLIEIQQEHNQELSFKKIVSINKSTQHENLKVVLKENGGKADALNCGISLSEHEYFCAIDADSLLNKDSLEKLVKPFEESDETVACGGVVRIVNGCCVENGMVNAVKLPNDKYELVQVVEYLRAFFFGRIGWTSIDSVMIISGAFGLFRKDIVIECGGYDIKTVGEDMELILKMRNYLMKTKSTGTIKFIPDAVCWTQCPDDYRTLRNQRSRWQRGLIESLYKHRNLFMNPMAGATGLIAFPFFVFMEALSPIVETIGYLSLIIGLLLGGITINVIIYFYLLSSCLGLLLSIGAIYTEKVYFNNYRTRQILKLILVSILENFWFRYLNLWWRCIGVYGVLTKRASWGDMKRKEFNNIIKT